MESQDRTRWTAFEGFRRIASGELAQVALETKRVIDRGETAPVLIFDDVTGEQIELDFRGTPEDVLKRLPPEATQGDPGDPGREGSRGPGRPKLGVVAREVTLLPRHWDWLNSQPGGASVALRKLVEEARRVNEGKDRVRRGAGGDLSVHVRHGRRLARLRGGGQGPLRRGSRALHGAHPRLAGGRSEGTWRGWSRAPCDSRWKSSPPTAPLDED